MKREHVWIGSVDLELEVVTDVADLKNPKLTVVYLNGFDITGALKKSEQRYLASLAAEDAEEKGSSKATCTCGMGSPTAHHHEPGCGMLEMRVACLQLKLEKG